MLSRNHLKLSQNKRNLWIYKKKTKQQPILTYGNDFLCDSRRRMWHYMCQEQTSSQCSLYSNNVADVCVFVLNVVSYFVARTAYKFATNCNYESKFRIILFYRRSGNLCVPYKWFARTTLYGFTYIFNADR